MPKPYLQICFAILFIFQGIVCFGQWTKQNTGITSNLFTISPLNKDSIWIFGINNRKAMRSTDRAKTWDSLTTIKFNILAIACFGHHGLYVYSGSSSFDGVYYRSNDDGKSWERFLLRPEIRFKSFLFTSDSVGYGASDSRMYKTTDTGRHWTMLPYVTGSNISKMIFNQSAAYTMQIEKILITKDSWKTYLAYPIDFNNPSISNNFVFPSIQTGYIVGQGNNGPVYKSTDSGKTWVQMNHGLQADDELFGIYFFNDSVGYVCGAKGVIYFTDDGGKNWKKQPSSTTNTLNDIYFMSKDTGIIVGTNGTILKTTNGGFSGVEVVNHAQKIASVYPNPTGHVLNIKFTGPFVKGGLSIKISNSLGQMVSETKNITSDNIQVDMESLSVGTYFYTITAHENGQDYLQKGTVEVLR